MAEMTMEIERAFGIKVDEDILDVVTVNDLVTYIYERLPSELESC
jgi:acyl carrier protein